MNTLNPDQTLQNTTSNQDLHCLLLMHVLDTSIGGLVPVLGTLVRCQCISIFGVYHYENMPIQIYRKNLPPKTENFQTKNAIFLISAQNIDCGYSSEPPRRGGSNEYPPSMFLSRNKKIMYTPVNPRFTI